MLSCFNLKQLITEATYYTESTSSLLDLFLTNNCEAMILDTIAQS